MNNTENAWINTKSPGENQQYGEIPRTNKSWLSVVANQGARPFAPQYLSCKYLYYQYFYVLSRSLNPLDSKIYPAQPTGHGTKTARFPQLSPILSACQAEPRTQEHA
jgi:hypothetical protein